MCSELECGICYQPYNAGLRCPRALHCRHTFCESCLLALLSLPAARGASCGIEPAESGGGNNNRIIITCPLCRRVTTTLIIPHDERRRRMRMRESLRMDEDVFERMVAAGVVLDDDIGDDDAAEHTAANDGDTGEGDTGEARPTESDSSPPGLRGGKLRLSLKTVWGKITGDTHTARRRNCQTICMSDDDFRDIAMMTCYMF